MGWVTCRVVGSDVQCFEDPDASWRRALVVERFGESVWLCVESRGGIIAMFSPDVGVMVTSNANVDLEKVLRRIRSCTTIDCVLRCFAGLGARDVRVSARCLEGRTLFVDVVAIL